MEGEGDQLPDGIGSLAMASLAIFLSSAKVTKTHKMLGPEVGVMTFKAIAIRVMVMVMVMVMSRPVVGPKL